MISRYKHICRKILQTYNLSTLCHKKLEKLTTTVTKKDTESVIKNFPTKKSKNQIYSQINSTKYIEKITGNLQEISPKKCLLSWQLGLKIGEEEKCFQTQSMKPPSVWWQSQIRKPQNNIPNLYSYKSNKSNIIKQFNGTIKWSKSMIKWEFISQCRNCPAYKNIQCNHYLTDKKGDTYMVISTVPTPQKKFWWTLKPYKHFKSSQ